MVLASVSIAATRWILAHHQACQQVHARSAWRDGFMAAAFGNSEQPFVRSRSRVWGIRVPVEAFFMAVSADILRKLQNCRGQAELLLRGMKCEHR